MFIKQRSNTIFRNHEEFGYITDNRNFGYKLPNTFDDTLGDRIVSQSGAIFLSVLDRKPQPIDQLVSKICNIFPEIEAEIIKGDALEFYGLLEKNGFIVSGESIEECNSRDREKHYRAENPVQKLEDASRAQSAFLRSTEDRFNKQFGGKDHLTSLHIEITSRCNERCLHCYIPHEEKTRDIKPELFYRVLQQCKEMGVLNVTLSGGEPMLHKEFIQFLNRCNKLNFSVNVLSNLTLLTKDILEEMKANPLLSVQVSLYSMDSSIHDEITCLKGSFENTMRNISLLVGNEIPVQINCPIMKQNMNSYLGVRDWARKQDLQVSTDHIIIAQYNHSLLNLGCRLSIEEIENVFHNRLASDAEYRKEVQSEYEDRPLFDPSERICSVCQSSICMNENGNYYPCVGWQDFVVGNASENEIGEIWEKSDKVKFLRNLKKKDFTQCSHCEANDVCSVCMVRNANEHPRGDPLAVSQHFCSIVKMKRRVILGNKNEAL